MVFISAIVQAGEIWRIINGNVSKNMEDINEKKLEGSFVWY